MDEGRGTSIVHGARELDRVTVEDYNAELRDRDGFLGDRANRRAFWAIVDESRQRVRGVASDPLGATPTKELGKKRLDQLLVAGDPEAGGLVHGAIEEFTNQLVTVIERLLELPAWRATERIVVGGGLRGSRVGELVIGRASLRLKAGGRRIDLRPIHSDPDEAGLIGAVQLTPRELLGGRAGILAVDIGGSNVRAGVVEVVAQADGGGPRGVVRQMELWRHAEDDARLTRDGTVQRIAEMLGRLARWGEAQPFELVPFIAVACPGVIAASGHIERGGQNLPGDWESREFNLPARLREAAPQIDHREPLVLVHNDAVVQGLSELPFVADVVHWGALTIGTGLGNATFSNRAQAGAPPRSTP